MSATRPILEAVRDRLAGELPDYKVELFPDRPDTYRFIHPKGAVLVGYVGSKFGALEDLSMIAQERVITLDLTVFGRGLHSDGATLDLLDQVRLAIVGFRPSGCLKCHLIDEAFLSEEAGAWQYRLRVQTETQQVERVMPQDLPKMTQIYPRREGDALHPDLTPATP